MRTRTLVLLDWPPAALSPNARGHWSKRAKAAKKYRKDCYALAKIEKLGVDWDGPVHLYVTFFPPDRRNRDDDNLVASFKSGRDGIADALGIDDKRFVLHPIVFEETRPGGRVVVMLSRAVRALK